ncbi:hypothetical protein AAU01_35480 [Paenarthrobacter aurescens]|uniref:Uncharacterized protein n=1 Tax=Paenarthrobacter aurescens TaxID=43663 RepID=A0A4Y3NHV0_PAEAU|nr:hypothetical protein AAU01_35480 [Paenarthrobacter aurescens]
MLAPDSLAEHECILGSDGDDEGKAGGHAEAGGLEEVSKVHLSKVRFARVIRPAKEF